MISNRNVIIVLFICIVTVISSCSKFDDGPTFSLLSTKKRISRTWKIQSKTELATGITQYAGLDGWELTIQKEGNFEKKIVYNGKETIISGSWEFKNKNEIAFIYSLYSQSHSDQYEILRLTKEEFWIIDKIEEIHYFSDLDK